MKKPLKFAELGEEAKRTAAEEVYVKEAPSEDWTILSESISEQINYTIEEYKLGSGDIPWEDHYGVTMDLRSISTNKEFYASFLTKEQIELLAELEELSDNGLDHITFDGKIAFLLDGGYNDYDDDTGLGFLNEYGSQEEKDEFAFITLLEEELSEEQEETLRNIVTPLAEKLAEDLEKVIYDKLEEVEEKLMKIVKNAIDYYGSDKYYYDGLDSEGTYEEGKYRFNEQGNIVEIDEVVLCEYEEQYEAYIATKEKEEAA